MAPKKAAPPPTRRSGRIASRASSRASSVAADEDTTSVLGKISKDRFLKKTVSRNAPQQNSRPFSAILAIEKIMRGDIDYVDLLTPTQVKEVVSGMSERIQQLENQNSKLTSERDTAVRKYEEKRALRDSFFRMRFQEKRLSDAAESASEPISSTPIAENTSTTTSPPPAADNTDFTDSDLLAGTPAPPAARTSFFGSFLKNITSPFSALRSAPATPTQQPTITKKLGELPASRKRAAPEPTEPKQNEPVEPAQISQSENTIQTPSLREKTMHTPSLREPSTDRTQRAFTGPSSRNALAETSLTTITEQSEQSTTIAPMPTPSRAPRSVTQMRRMRNLSTPTTSTPSRAWNRPPPPREPNADRRMEKLRRYNQLKGEIQFMDEDEEVQEMTAERPMKRVKVDELVSIPHNRPGDAEGTFRMPDIDSDDEMEVDEDEVMRTNIFDVSAEEEVTKAPEAPSGQNQKERVVEKRAWAFPSVGEAPPASRPQENPLAGAKFAYGLEHWKLTGELLPLFV